MKILACDLKIGEPFKYEQEIYVPISIYAGELYALKLENFIRIPYNALIDIADIFVSEKENK